MVKNRSYRIVKKRRFDFSKNYDRELILIKGKTANSVKLSTVVKRFNFKNKNVKRIQWVNTKGLKRDEAMIERIIVRGKH